VPPEKSVDELLSELERVQAQKAELEKKEQELKALVRKRLEKQTERLNKLLPPANPDRVGQIIIEGNTTTPNQKILDMLGITPGDVLRYPALEEARAKLKKAFQDSTVEVIPGDLDSVFKNIRVRVVEPQVVTPPTVVVPKGP
jgi:hypothetical protein